MRSPREFLESLEDTPDNTIHERPATYSAPPDGSSRCFVCGRLTPLADGTNGVCPDCANGIHSPLEFLQSLEPSDGTTFRESSEALAMASASSLLPGDPYSSPNAPQPRVRNRSLGHLFRAIGCLLLGLAICGYCVSVLLFGGVLFLFLVGLGPALVLVGLIELFYWYDD